MISEEGSPDYLYTIEFDLSEENKLDESVLNESIFDKVGTVKNMEVVKVDGDETIDWYLEISCSDGTKYYTKLRHERSFDPDNDY